MAVISGKNGAMDGIGTLRDWLANVSNEVQEYFASDTGGAAVTVEGNSDWNATANAYGAEPGTAYMPGDEFTFTGSVDGSVGLTGPAIIDQLEITIPIEDGGLISYRLSFSANGAHTLGAAVASDAGDPDAPTAVARKLRIATDITNPVYADIAGVRSITITLSRDNKAYNTSGTGGDTERVMGNLTGTLAYDLYEGAVADLPTLGAHVGFRAFTTATEYWVFEWGQIAEISDLGANVETGDLVSGSISAKFSGHATSGGTVYDGQLVDPSANTYWP